MLSSRNSKARVKAALALGLLLHRQMSYEEKHSTRRQEGKVKLNAHASSATGDRPLSAFLTPEFAELSTVPIYIRHSH